MPWHKINQSHRLGKKIKHQFCIGKCVITLIMHTNIETRRIEWKNRYESIRRFFDYCDFLKTCDEDQQFYAEFYESEEFKHIAIKPQFLYPNGDTMPIRLKFKN
uniref:Uncharacterized protein n=1 Tax=Globodera rostochiensis TaxID=31243 RepID=A0A914ICN7_GLORO